MNQKVIKITIPRLIFADDYHEFPNLAQQFSDVTGESLTVTEIGFADGHGYVGVMHKDMLTTEVADGLLEEVGIVLDEGE